MDITEWIRQEEQDLLAHIEDSLRTGDFTDMWQTETDIHQGALNLLAYRAWQELQAVPSYVEQQAAAFAGEPLEEQPVEPQQTARAWWLNNSNVW